MQQLIQRLREPLGRFGRVGKRVRGGCHQAHRRVGFEEDNIALVVHVEVQAEDMKRYCLPDCLKRRHGFVSELLARGCDDRLGVLNEIRVIVIDPERRDEPAPDDLVPRVISPNDDRLPADKGRPQPPEAPVHSGLPEVGYDVELRTLQAADGLFEAGPVTRENDVAGFMFVRRADNHGVGSPGLDHVQESIEPGHITSETAHTRQDHPRHTTN